MTTSGATSGAAERIHAVEARSAQFHRELGLAALVLTQIMYALILASCLKAYGGSLSFTQIIFINTFVSLFGGLIPVPGGIGVFEAGFTAGLTAMGIDPAIATAAVLTDRLVTAYIPPVFGYFSINWMTKHDYL